MNPDVGAVITANFGAALLLSRHDGVRVELNPREQETLNRRVRKQKSMTADEYVLCVCVKWRFKALAVV